MPGARGPRDEQPGAPRRRGPRAGEQDATPLGSLSLPAAESVPGTAVCSVCASTSLTRLHLVLGDGTPVVFVSCHDCEHKAWFVADGVGVELTRDDVVARSAKPR